jgi:UDP-N-acetylmuramate: L-alanyl-gamma-D-glutamyl-meso-diaminopimelate ligase
MKDALAAGLTDADRVYCYGAGLGWDADAALASLGSRAAVYSDLPQLVAAIAAEARHGDHILVMSNGGFGGIHGKLLEQLEKNLVR